jgi:putative hemin transport protein
MSVARYPHTVEELRARWNDYRAQHRRAFRYDAARAFGVSEAELLAVECGNGVTRLEGDWRELLRGFEGLGRIMALTRNRWAVHEKKGHYAPVSFTSHTGLVLGEDIDLRLFMQNWARGFAVFNPESKGHERSFQFFDAAGNSIHKVFVENEGAEVFDGLVERFRAADQERGERVDAEAPPAEELPDDEIDAQGLQEAWGGLQDTHDFFPLLKRFKVKRTQAFRLAGRRFAVPLDPAAYTQTLTRAAEHDVPIMIFVGNQGCIQIHSGTVSRPVEVEGWLNTFQDGFNLHLLKEGVAETWLTRKPTTDGIVTGIELFDAEGREIAFLFGKRKPGRPELESWRKLCAGIE